LLHGEPGVARHGGRAQYRANQADQQAWESALRPKPCLLATHSKLQQIVAKLMQDWSPQQISGWLKRQYPNDESLRVSHETIYRSLFIQARGALKQELVRHLRSQRRIRRSRHSSVGGEGNLAYFLASGSLSRACKPRNSFRPSENVTFLPTARVERSLA
jgi:IS30 family transposase